MKGSLETLLEVVRHFADERRAWEYMRLRRWPDGKVICPRCQSEKVHLIETRMLWRCNGCKRQFSLKVGSVFEDSPIGFSKWLPAMWLIVNAKNGISSYELHRALGVTQKTAWFMLHRLRLVMQSDSGDLFGGHVEVDETYIGGKARNMHHGPRRKVHAIGGGFGKEMVLGFVERGGKVRTLHVKENRRQFIEDTVRANVAEGSNLYTDAMGSYRFMDQWYKHQFVDHAVRYAEGHVHTNTLESYWSLFKRAIKGTYVSVEPWHLFRYNERKGTDGERFVAAVSSVMGKRLTYANLTGKECPQGA